MKNLGLNEVVVGLGLALGAGCNAGSVHLGDDTARQNDSGVVSDGGASNDGGAPDGGLGSTEESLFDPCPKGDNLHCMTVATQEQCAKALEIADQLDPSDIRVYPLDGSLTRDGETFGLDLISSDSMIDGGDTTDWVASQHFACLELYTGEGNQGVKGLSFMERDDGHLSTKVVLTPDEWASARVLALTVGVVDQVVYRSTLVADSDNRAYYFPMDGNNPTWMK